MMTAQYQEALHSYAEGRYEEAMRQFSELLYEDPRNPKLHIWLGAAFRKAGKIEYAKVQYQQVLTLTDDQDLLDLAKTSLAQIQNKLATSSKNSKKDLPKNRQRDLVNTHNPDTKGLRQELEHQNFSPKSNGSLSIAPNHPNHIFIPDQDLHTEDITLLAHPSIQSTSKATGNEHGSNGHGSNGYGSVPPPPAIALKLKKKQLEGDQDQQTLVTSTQAPTLQLEHVLNIEDIAEKSESSILKDAIANLEKGIHPNSLNGNSKRNLNDNLEGKKDEKVKSQIDFPSLELQVESQILADDDTAISSQDPSDRASQTPIALEDMFTFSTLGQKITLWGALLATIPAVIVGVAAYHGGEMLLLNKAKQKQQSDVIALAKATGRFLRQQTTDVAMLKTLLVATEVGQNTLQSPAPIAEADSNKATIPKNLSSQPIAQQRQYKQLLTNRLSLYSQAYPQYTSIALFTNTGELIAQSTNSKVLQTLNFNPLNLNPQSPNTQSPNSQSPAVPNSDTVVIGNPIVGKNGASLYAVTAVKSSISQKINMVLQVEIPVKTLVNELTNTGLTNNTNSYNFYLVDSTSKYVASSQPVKIGEDALEDFGILSSLRLTQSPDSRDIVRGDRTEQILAYTPVSMLGWDLLTVIDKDKAVLGLQNLLLAISLGIAATPLLVAAIAYTLSQRLTRRLKEVRSALRFLRRSLRRGDSDISFDPIFGRLSVEGNDELADISLSINRMSDQLQMMMKKQEQENQRLQLQAVKMFKVLSKLAREEKKEGQEADLSDANILSLGKKVRAEMVQRNTEVEGYRQQQQQLQEHLQQMLKDMQGLTDGDLTVSISTQSPDGNLTNISIFFDDVIRGLQNIVAQVKSSANQVNLSLGENEQAIANLVVVSQRQVDTVERAIQNAQVDQISAANLANNSQQIMQSSQLVATKLSDSDRDLDAVLQKIGGLQSTVTNTAKRVKHLGEVSQKVSKAISSINEIAIKTNFLAINASLEASRTGDMSGGFVIVAEEVGDLTARSVAVTKEVEHLLGNIQRETNEVMEAVELGSSQVSESNQLAIAAKDSLQQIAHVSHQIDELMSSISEVTISQVQTSEGVANLMQHLSLIANKTLTSSEQVSQTIKSTRQYSGELRQSLNHFKTRS